MEKINKIKIFKNTLTIGLLSLFLCNSSVAQESEGLYDMSLEDLMNLTVTSASKKEEKAVNAPSIITTITAKEIEDFGGANLYEVLERSPSFYGVSSFFFRKNSIGLRGDLPSHINPRILFLINGRPFRESVFGGQNVGILTAFPVYSIKQIEIIRGPGSVLYGTNAYVGVVNVITKDSTEPELNVRGGGGTFGTKTVQVNGGASLGELQVNGGINYFKSDGWRFADSTRTRGPNKLFGEADLGEDILSTDLQLRFKQFTLSGFYSRNDIDHITVVTSDESVYKSRRLFLDLGYDADIIPGVYNLSTNITYNRMEDSYDNGLSNATSTSTPLANDYIFELTNFFTLSEKIELTVGGSFSSLSGESRTSETLFSVNKYTSNWFNGYFQTDYKATEWLKFVLGGQVNKVADIDANFVPRIAAIANFSSGFGGKILYGKAFRAPFNTETGIFSPPTISGNANLVPENISTFETQLSYNMEKGNIAFTYFRSKQTDLIGRIPNPDATAGTALTYTNAGELTSQGIEIETKFYPSQTFYLTGSYSFQTNKDGNNNKNISRLPQHMLKLGGSLKIKDYANIGIFNSYYSSPIDRESASDGLGQLGAFSWLTARLDLEINKLMNLGDQKFGLVIEGVNLFDKKVYNPEIIFGAYNAVQNKAGRGINVSAYLKF